MPSRLRADPCCRKDAKIAGTVEGGCMRRCAMGLVVLILASIPATPVVTRAEGRAQQAAASQKAKPLPPIAEKTDGFRKLDGFYPLYWDDAAGTLYLEIP